LLLFFGLIHFARNIINTHIGFIIFSIFLKEKMDAAFNNKKGNIQKSYY